MNERTASTKYMNFCRIGRIPHVEYNMKTGDLNVYSTADPRVKLDPLPDYCDISSYVWAYAQFGDILTAIRAAEIICEMDHEYGNRKIDFQSVMARMSEETKYNDVFQNDALCSMLAERYSRSMKEAEIEELEGKLAS